MMIRKTGLFLIVVVPLVALVWLYVARNAIVTGIATLSLERMLGSPVQLEGVDVDPFAMQATFTRLRIVDKDTPSQFLLVAGPARFKMNGLQLFARKLVIEDLSVEGLGFGLPRPDYRPPPPPTKEELARQEVERQAAAAKQATAKTPEAAAPKEDESDWALDVPLPKLNLDALEKDLDVERITGGQRLASLQALDQAETDAKARYQSLDERSERLNAKPRMDAIRAKSDALDFQTKDPRKIQETLKGLREALTETKALAGETKALAKDVRAEPGRLKADYATVDKEFDADVAATLRLTSLGGMDLKRAGMMLFGQPLLERFNWVMARFKQVRGMMGADGKPQTELPRRTGRTISYPVTARAYPGFLVQRIAFKGAVQDAAGAPTREFTGTLVGLNSNARVYGKPTVLEATATGSAKERWIIQGIFDHRTSPGADRLIAKGRGVRLDDVRLSGGSWPQKAVSSTADITLQAALSLDALDGSLRVDANQVRFVFGGPNGAPPNRTMADLFGDLERVSLEATLGGSLRRPKFDVSSSLDEAFSGRLKSMLGKRQEEAKAKVRAKLNEQVAARRAQVDKVANERRQALEAKVQAVEARVDALEQELAARQAELERKAKDATGAATDKAKEKGKDLLRKLKR